MSKITEKTTGITSKSAEKKQLQNELNSLEKPV